MISKKFYKQLLLILSFFLFIFNFSFLIFNLRSSAHPQPLVVQEFVFHYRQNAITVDLNLRIDPVVIDSVFSKLDKNSDQELSGGELKAYFEEIVKPNLVSRFNNRDMEYEITGYKTAKKLELLSLDNYAQIQLKVSNADIKETNSIYVKYKYPFVPNDSFGDAYVYNDDIFDTPGIERINLQSTDPTGIIEYTTDFKFKDFNPNTASNTIQNTNSSSQAQTNTNLLKDLQNLSTDLTNQVKNLRFDNPWVFLTAFLLLFIAGALHALTPGHGKSMVAAFLVAKKNSKFADVLVLGASITLAHTASIYIIGFILLALKQTAYAQNIVVVIERVSAWLFLGLGLLLVYNGWKAYSHFKSHQHEHDHHHDHKHNHSHDDHHGHDHSHEDHHHSHKDSHHDRGHTHAWDDKNLKIKNRWDLFYAGISGGIIPCLDALSILFVFNSLGRVDLGLIMVFIFSLGLAGAIILLGATLLYGKDKLKLEERIGARAEYILPIISGLIVAGFGVFYILTK